MSNRSLAVVAVIGAIIVAVLVVGVVRLASPPQAPVAAPQSRN